MLATIVVMVMTLPRNRRSPGRRGRHSRRRRRAHRLYERGNPAACIPELQCQQVKSSRGGVSHVGLPDPATERGFCFLALTHTSTALPSHCCRDPMLVLERKQEEEAAAEKREQARKFARMSLARIRAESLFTKDAD